MNDEKIISLILEGKKITAIKLLKAKKKWTLRKSKEYVDRLSRKIKSRPNGEMLDEKLANQALQILLQHKFSVDGKIKAIKLIHYNTEMSVSEAKNYVVALDLKHDPAKQKQVNPALKNEVIKMIAHNQKVSAIKLIHKKTGMSLMEAYRYVNNL